MIATQPSNQARADLIELFSAIRQFNDWSPQRRTAVLNGMIERFKKHEASHTRTG